MSYTQANNRQTVVVSGVLLEGAGEDSFFTVESMGENQMVVGVDGKGGYILTANRGAKIDVTLQSGSASNDHMQAEYSKQMAGRGYLPSVAVRDGSGRMELNAPDCVIVKLPNSERGKDATEVVWSLLAVDGAYTVGGNS